MIDDIQIYNVKNVREIDENDKILRQHARNSYKAAKRSLKKCNNYIEMADIEDKEYAEFKKENISLPFAYFKTSKFFYDYLNSLENNVAELTNILLRTITYKPQKEQLKEVQKMLFMEESYAKPHLIENVINNCSFEFTGENVAKLENHEDDAEYHLKFLIEQFKQIVNILCKIMKTNELPKLFR